MKKYLFSVALLLPLAIVIVLAIGGVTMNRWVYVILSVVCPVAAGAFWYMYRDTDRKMEKSH